MTSSTHSNQKPKKILYSVLGLSPQILTETLYALVHQKPAFIPDEIHVLTTARGAQQCRLALFNEKGGWFHRFCQDFNLKGIQFNETQITALTDKEGKPIDDIRSPEDNNAVANRITQQIKLFTQDEGQLHVSIAGGRKTMSFYAGYALSMFGRPEDRLSHVLVEEHFEGHPHFYYPTPYSHIIHGRNNEILEARDAKVDLAYLPFVRLRHALDANLIQETQTFEQLVKHLQQNLQGEIKVTILQAKRSLMINNQLIPLSPVNFVFYCWLASRTQNGQGGLTMPVEGAPDKTYAKEFIQTKEKVIEEMRDMDRTLEKLKNGMEHSFIRDRKNDIKKMLQKHLGVNAEPYIIHIIGKKPYHQHGFTLKSQQIIWE